MTQEQKAKAYDEALERARAFFENENYTEMADVFPELRESEDERIRKRLIDCLKVSLKGAEEQDAAGCSRQKDIEAYKWGIAYLEKQKEPNYTKRNELFDKCVENCDPEIMKEVSDVIDKELQKEQKPEEWSDGDEGMINCIIATLCEESHGGREKNDLMVSWLDKLHKSLRPQRYNP